MMITPFGRPMATTKQLSSGVILSLSRDIQPFPDDLLVLKMIQLIFRLQFARKISCLGALDVSSSDRLIQRLPDVLRNWV